MDSDTPAYRFDPFRLEPAARRLWHGDKPVTLGARAFDLLLALVRRHGHTVGKSELMDLVWPQLVVEENNLQVQVMALRKALGHAAIATVPGRGYCFTLPVAAQGADVAEAAGHAAGLAASSSSSSPASPESAADRLPPWLPELIGRAADRTQLAALLRGHRLVTVVGPGGIGKTRLAQAVLGDLREVHTSAWWVDLAPLRDGALLPGAVAQAMALPLDRVRDIAHAVRHALAALSAPSAPGVPAASGASSAREALLVLDNAEHLLDDVASFVADVRRAAPRLRLLVTSQESLRLPDEQVLRLAPLALPADDQPLPAEPGDAEALFIARARAADRRFTCEGAAGRALVADICRRLDGIPLAIELAAARVPLLGLLGLRERLDQRLAVLTAGARSALPRHQTLRAALEWSHALLAEPERAVLARLAVFAGGFALDAAQQVAADEQGIDAWDVLEHLGALVDKSLVVVEAETAPIGSHAAGAAHDRPPRYRLLETTRLFAMERLIERGEAAAARTRHREHYADVATKAREWMLLADARGLSTLDRERDNLLLALAWAGDDPGAAQGLRLAAGLRYYWTARGQLARGLEAMQQVLDRPGAGADSGDRVIVLGTLANFRGSMGDHEGALREAQAALASARRLGERRGLSLALAGAGFVAVQRGALDEARALADEARTLVDRLGDGHERGNVLTLQALLHARAGEHAAARELQRETVAMRRRLGHGWSEAMGHLNLAQMAVDADDAPAALPHLARVVELLPAVDSQVVALHLIGMSGEWAAATGRHAWSVLLDAACVALYARTGLEDALEPAQVQRLAQAREALPSAQREALQAAGRALGIPAAVAQVRRFLADPESPCAAVSAAPA